MEIVTIVTIVTVVTVVTIIIIIVVVVISQQQYQLQMIDGLKHQNKMKKKTLHDNSESAYLNNYKIIV